MTGHDDELFEQKKHALDKEFHTCPKCGQALQFRTGKSGPFFGCTAYPACDFSRPLHPEQDEFETKIIDGSACPKCQHQLAVKHGRFGMFIGCTNYPTCDFIQHDEQEKPSEIACPKCQKGQLKAKNSRFGKRFFACDQYPDCQYAVNFEPVEQSCPDCGWQLLVKKKLRGQFHHVCPQKKCGYQSEPLDDNT